MKAFSGRAGLTPVLRGDDYINNDFAGKDSSSEKNARFWLRMTSAQLIFKKLLLSLVLGSDSFLK